MKRYDFRVKNGVPGLYAVEDGDYYFVPDVTRTMIPRPDTEAARKALAYFEDAVRLRATAYDNWSYESHDNAVKQARAAVLALMGVEVK